MSKTHNQIEVVVSSDFICPWCWVGQRRLTAGIEMARLTTPPIVRYQPYEINPAMPLEGMSRRLYRSAKLGSWARSQAMDAEVQLAGRELAAEFNFDLIDITPNTRLAHRLMFLARAEGIVDRAEALQESIFRAYFTEGRDIGSLDVLVILAAANGFDPVATRLSLLGPAGESEVVAIETQTQSEGIRSLPVVRINGTQVSGAQPAAVLAEALRAAVAKADALH
ncbi:MAG: DsbA family oxidoreductase [Vicinamibacteria bacterium]